MQGCTVFNPYISQPNANSTFQGTLENIEKVRKDMNYAMVEQHVIGSISSFGTFVGFGGAGISAIFHASLTSILAFTSVGATSMAFNGLYANAPRIAIYNAGIGALACINSAIAPLAEHDENLKSARRSVQNGVKSINSRLEERKLTAVSSNPPAQAILNLAEDTERRIGEKITNEDTSASAITTALRSVVSSVNSQLETVVPDAAALARAGASLSGLVINGLPLTPPRPAPPAAAPPPGAVAPPFDDLLNTYINNLTADIKKASVAIQTKVTPPAISCTVANAPTITPITVTLPTGSTGITYPVAGGNRSYSIEGGTRPYMSIQWAGAQPTCFSAVIHSPNTLFLSPPVPPPAAGGGCTLNDSYNFDIYDSHGQHMAQTLQVTIK